MTPTERWILGLVLVYSVPSFISGIGLTLLAVRWRDIRRAATMTPRFLSPELTFDGPIEPKMPTGLADDANNLGRAAHPRRQLSAETRDRQP
jgi:hypothetical protein